MRKAQLILALDLETFERARQLIDEVADAVDIFKVGSQMFTAYGPFITRYLQSKAKKVFLDLKFHDIPNTVASAVKSAVGLSVSPNRDPDFTPLFMLTVHTAGGREMLEASVHAAEAQAKALGVPRPLLVGVTVLTSAPKDAGTRQLVLERARLAQESGLDGVVASVEEAALIRRELGKDFLIVTPGIRPLEASSDDQKRVATPKAAMDQGSDFLVVGRPILHAASPREAALKILGEMKR
ncbi:MAG: orotidine-5'-phosphate decarboxylase [Candidatus Omnitrophica bacterium]|nr:orotidine-5'-phosphate decarboxylase [Candidatus Omnitrophota bacterium]MDE2009906.1 orotidine-5'-phosphate decarboxylase [Candidatus Omnitrophota bacterium]MDE2214994.1 orotidine-5'-phosphate decarboxylase [Candidatus Omnitrophota bacterium]MDE2232112.1 orotidine-5'-phosphate decarboxylase [Candidatus Omnitrophota bacterium]